MLFSAILFNLPQDTIECWNFIYFTDGETESLTAWKLKAEMETIRSLHVSPGTLLGLREGTGRAGMRTHPISGRPRAPALPCLQAREKSSPGEGDQGFTKIYAMRVSGSSKRKNSSVEPEDRSADPGTVEPSSAAVLETPGFREARRLHS